VSKKNAPQSIFTRGAELFGMAAKIGAKEIGRRVNEKIGSNEKLTQIKSQVEQAKILVESLGRLKGAAMKVGQMLSLEGSDFLPPQVLEVLSQLQNKAPPVPFEDLVKVLKGELGEEVFAQLQNLNPKALASASIGQVHRADYNGRELILKIQYPGISESIDSDLQLLQKIARSMMLLGGRSNIDTASLFEELGEVLKQEVDYVSEAKHLERFAAGLAQNKSFRVPKVEAKFSRRKVLALSFERGLSITEWLKQKPSQADRDYLGSRMLELYFWEFFEFGSVQTDPNLANFLIDTQSDKKPFQIVLLDFGATRNYDRDFIEQYKILLSKIEEKNFKESLELSF
jgi:aarF domain-containing kinase